MGKQFKNSFVIKILGWFSVISLTYLNLRGLPGQIESFFGSQATISEISLADNIAYAIIVAVLLLLAWTIIELYQGNKKHEQYLKEVMQEEG